MIIEEALHVLGLTQTATCADVKRAYYALARKYHPDICKKRTKKNCEERFKAINHAHKILVEYCKSHGALFDTKSIKKNVMGEEYYNHLKQFYDGWWGTLDL